MPLHLDEKKSLVRQANEIAQSASAVVAADYRGMTVAELTDMRARARNEGIKLTVIRNTLARRAIQGTEHECLNDVLSGPTMLGFSIDEPGAGARLFREIRRTSPNLAVKGISVGGSLYDDTALAKVAALPTRDEALARLMGTMMGPVTKLAQTLKGVPSKLVRTLVAVKDAKDEAT